MSQGKGKKQLGLKRTRVANLGATSGGRGVRGTGRATKVTKHTFNAAMLATFVSNPFHRNNKKDDNNNR